ncbi:hypothetical protein [Streptomyces scopuliridis]|uniref:Uncharacterized protein n=1 Tax=Streptomyces scopuliridis TaxID=452529 RepID=A0ACD4ZTY4_9ACTN|nr:hypothetical protein [Streptomyces scopuliridis]WSC01243.1 hypothetical protein OG835_32430 [Streptomyces scopuliridis]
MPIFKVVRTDRTDYDEYDEVIVRAGNESDALNLVLTSTGHWLYDGKPMSGFRADESNASVERVVEDGPSEIILGSFNAG